MKKSQAVKLIARLAFAIAKLRSNAIEAVSAHGTSWEELSPTWQSTLQQTQPALFPKEGRISLIDALSRMQAKGDDLAPTDLYNVLVLIERDDMLGFMIGMFGGNGIPLPKVHPMPSWLMGFEDEEIKESAL